MPLRISFDLADADLHHFEHVAQQTQAMARAQDAEGIVAAARDVLERAERAALAQFVKERFTRLRLMLDMMADAEWQAAQEDRQRVVNALACFGSRAASMQAAAVEFLEHAIMIELVSRDLEHDLAAYREFCRFRERHSATPPRPGTDPGEHVRKLEHKRETLHARMHARRKRDLNRAGSSVRRLFSLFRL